MELGRDLTPTAPGSSQLPSPPSPFVACGLSSPPRPPGSEDVTAWSSSSLTPSCCSWRSLARPLSGSLAEPRGRGLGTWGGGALCACVSGPYLFSPPLILVLPAAPHTKPHSPNPQGGERGASFTQLPYSGPPIPALQLAQASSVGPSGPQPCTGPCLRSASGKSSCLPFLSKTGPVASTFWFLGAGHTLPGALEH